MSTLLEQAKSIPHGIEAVSDWLGSGGEVVEPQEAQSRAAICLTCDKNTPGNPVTTSAALAIRKLLSVKNRLKLRVTGEQRLANCEVCNCVLRLQVWMKQDKVREQLTDEERALLPDYCWKLR